MPDQANVFDDKPVEPQQQQQSTTSTPDYSDLLKLVRNESGEQKYDSIPKAFEGLAHAQQYIPQLKNELLQKDAEIANLREQLSKTTALEEVVSRITAQQQAPVKDEPTVTSGLDPRAVEDLVKNILQQTKQQESAESNILKVQQALTAKYGDKTVEMLEAKAQELGTTRQELGQLASKNPAMVLALFGTQAPTGAKPTTSSVVIPSSYTPPVETLKRPEKSLLSGATSKEQEAFMAKVKADVYARYGIQQ